MEQQNQTHLLRLYVSVYDRKIKKGEESEK